MEDEKKVSRLSLGFVIIVFLIKIIVAFFINSLSFHVELLDSILDFITVIITFVALKQSQKPADNEHMYGHYKVNSIAGFIQSIILIGLYCFIFYKSIYTLIFEDNYETENSLLGAISLMIVLILVFFVSRIIINIGKKTNNQAIIAQGANFRGDLYRNISVIIGLTITYFGFSILDLILACIFSIISIRSGFIILSTSFNELIDANLITDDRLDKIKEKILKIRGINHIDNLAIKTAGNHLDANINICLEKDYSLFYSSIISNEIRDSIKLLCPSYNENISIQFNMDKENSDFSYFYEIREIIQKEEKKYNIHNIIIDKFQDSIIIQFHVMIAASMQLNEAHKIISSLENRIINRLESKYLDSKIKIISHIEPMNRYEKVHSHKLEEEIEQIDLNTKKFIENYCTHNSDIISINNLQIISDQESFSIILSVSLLNTITVEKAHEIAEKIEFDFHYNLKNLAHCLVHTEP